MKNAKKITSLLAISCMLCIIVGPLGIWMVYQKAAFPGELSASGIEINESFSPADNRKTTEIWAYPATTNANEVRCITEKNSEEVSLDSKNTEVTFSDTEVTHLFTNDGEYSHFDRIQCQGGDVESIYISSHFSDQTAHRFIFALSIATPILTGSGFILYRRNQK
ncbi:MULTISPECIES: hypothetical protein [Oceanobacillus]|uniref:Uncharacterized protein n=2 Tax=Oceanobacillus TaxID=182709 RepID=A0A0A1MYL4_9BACI|nr:hypothetical protein [Oceanobacillus oncorhynchi]MDM8100399.1 hypothetical protein [Oceanobacillus oncorhynchi]CEI83831.1 hypothetical protein BN997_03752 [Oceanobacillus oncorhynchi]